MEVVGTERQKFFLKDGFEATGAGAEKMFATHGGGLSKLDSCRRLAMSVANPQKKGVRTAYWVRTSWRIVADIAQGFGASTCLA